MLDNDTVVQNAMTIILHAGDARVACKEALEAIAEADFAKAEEKIKKANSQIVLAHKTQTDAIQGETRGEEAHYSLLFAHAQDTLMTIYSEINIAKQMIDIFKNYNERLEKVEQVIAKSK